VWNDPEIDEADRIEPVPSASASYAMYTFNTIDDDDEQEEAAAAEDGRAMSGVMKLSLSPRATTTTVSAATFRARWGAYGAVDAHGAWRPKVRLRRSPYSTTAFARRAPFLSRTSPDGRLSPIETTTPRWFRSLRGSTPHDSAD
jgi:hypothetical protein